MRLAPQHEASGRHLKLLHLTDPLSSFLRCALESILEESYGQL
jgi:hypothetical protein